MLESLRIDLRPLGISVHTVCPGFVRTDLTAKNTFPMPFMLEADDAARRIVRGLEKGKAEIVFPLPMLVADEGREGGAGQAVGRGVPAGAATASLSPASASRAWRANPCAPRSSLSRSARSRSASASSMRPAAR